ncbi:hypothetical protein J8G26_18950 [Acidovorax sp. JG5]|uniref:hypothetical protein n=1 Tax=Acidovorax sp. JG5 TaxID=2822718 RepID=UPI001B328055|nr:hypothetical protein [Acidovorax sp. JG5]MBP3982741.1 hypothetical protein [Acidovorax sp. JG5]
MTKPPSQNAIGRALGLSSPAMTKMKKQGCPMTSIEAVRAWREKHLNIAMRKPEPRRTTAATRDHLAHAQACMRGAAALLVAGLPLDVFAPTLRAALRNVPPELRDAVGLDLEVMKTLLAPVLALIPEEGKDTGEKMTDDDAQDAGQFLYSVACGEIIFVPDGGPS